MMPYVFIMLMAGLGIVWVWTRTAESHEESHEYCSQCGEIHFKDEMVEINGTYMCHTCEDNLKINY